jgi:hypothetical protein
MPGSTGANGGVSTVRCAGLPHFPPMGTREWLHCVHKPKELAPNCGSLNLETSLSSLLLVMAMLALCRWTTTAQGRASDEELSCSRTES